MVQEGVRGKITLLMLMRGSEHTTSLVEFQFCDIPV